MTRPFSKTIIEAKKTFKPCFMVFQILQTENSSIVTDIYQARRKQTFGNEKIKRVPPMPRKELAFEL